MVGVGRTQMDDDGFRGQFRDSLREFAKVEGDDEVASSLAGRIFYVAGELGDAALYQRLKAKLDEIDGAEGVLHYLAIPPGVSTRRSSSTSGAGGLASGRGAGVAPGDHREAVRHAIWPARAS